MNAGDLPCKIVAPEGQMEGYSTYANGIGGVAFTKGDDGWKISRTFYAP